MKGKKKWYRFIPVLWIGFVVIFIVGNLVEAYAYTDSNLYEEKLVFDAEGNLIMTTHDKKATTKIIYQTIAWVIKRYDMPLGAPGQQYAIISIGNNIEYRDDPENDAYVYCYYYGDKDTISAAIEQVSPEWKKQLYKYGDYVYIDEIMTVVENGTACGGLNMDGSSYGEVYYDFNGISNARDWASKESLRPLFDKSVYFPQQVTEEVFRYQLEVLSQYRQSHTAAYEADIAEGSRIKKNYDIESGVPTGSKLYVEGTADKLEYEIVYDKSKITFYIPVKFVITYKLCWKAYDGSIQYEDKVLTEWYCVKREGSYYIISDMDVRYLSGIELNSYAFENNQVYSEITGCSPYISKAQNDAYYSHVSFEEYQDVYYIDGGMIAQMAVNGVKPSIPDIDRQAYAESGISNITVSNDYLSINGKTMLDAKDCDTEGASPATSSASDRKSVYYAGFQIPHTKMNSSNLKTTGYYIYLDYNTGETIKKKIDNMSRVNIHTPVYVDGGTLHVIGEDSFEQSEEIQIIEKGKPFWISAQTTGNRRDIKGYGYRDYDVTTKKYMVKFSSRIIRNGEEIGENTWVEFCKDDRFEVPDTVAEGNYTVMIRAYAANYAAVPDSIENHIENTANLSRNHYVAQTEFEIGIGEQIKNPDKIVVGTH